MKETPIKTSLLDESNKITFSVLTAQSAAFFNAVSPAEKTRIINTGILNLPETWCDILSYSNAAAFQFFYELLSKEQQIKFKEDILLPSYIHSLFLVSTDAPTEKIYLWNLFIQWHGKEKFSQLLGKEKYQVLKNNFSRSVFENRPTAAANLRYLWLHIPLRDKSGLVAEYSYLVELYIPTLHKELTVLTKATSATLVTVWENINKTSSMDLFKAKMICELAVTCNVSLSLAILKEITARGGDEKDFIRRLFNIAMYANQALLFKTLQKRYPELEKALLNFGSKLSNLTRAVRYGSEAQINFAWNILTSQQQKESIADNSHLHIRDLLMAAVNSEDPVARLEWVRMIYKEDNERIRKATYLPKYKGGDVNYYAIWEAAVEHTHAVAILDYLYEVLLPGESAKQQKFIDRLQNFNEQLVSKKSDHFDVWSKWFAGIIAERKKLAMKSATLLPSLFAGSTIPYEKEGSGQGRVHK